MDNVKCADCGYLAVRHFKTRDLLDAEEMLRRTGEMPVEPGTQHYIYDPWPVCFARVIDFRSALDDNSGTPHRKRVINDDRECARFTPWIQGLTPKEHVELQQELDRQLWQTQRELQDQTWREQQEDKADQRHRESLKAASRTSLLSAGIGFLGGLTAAVLAYLLANWPW